MYAQSADMENSQIQFTQLRHLSTAQPFTKEGDDRHFRFYVHPEIRRVLLSGHRTEQGELLEVGQIQEMSHES